MTELDHDEVLALSDGGIISFPVEQLLEGGVAEDLVDVTGLVSTHQLPADATCAAKAALINLDADHTVVLLTCFLIKLVRRALDYQLKLSVR